MTSSDSLQSEIFSNDAEIKCPQCEKLQFEPSHDVLSGKLCIGTHLHIPVAHLEPSLIADPECVSLILAQHHTFVEIDREHFSMDILFLPLIQERL